MNIDTIRHSAAHVMAEAVLSLFPNAKFGIGPSISNGFYYDFELPRSLTTDDIPIITDKMNEIINKDLPFKKEEVNKENARQIFSSQPYKLELIDEIEENMVSLYSQGEFTDLCRGPHVESTGKIKAFKLLSIAGAYWRGDENNQMLQRIYGTAFESKDTLDDYIRKLNEAGKRDHRKLGKELDLFSINEECGSGLVLWHPLGATIRRIIEQFWKDEHLKRGYDILYTPHIAKLGLWKTSGHWKFYRDNMYSPMEVDEEEYIIKPMNCVYHILIYKTRLRSYRELPLRWAELGTVYRYERSGVLHGLSRVRGFTQDDAHIFCRFEQLEDEVVEVLDLALLMIDTFGFNKYKILLSTRPEKYAGTIDMWQKSTDILSIALERKKCAYEIDPGEGVFYGPKIDIKFEDAIGRAWQGPTIQVDFNLPKRFEVTYIGDDGKEQPIAMVHRTVLGSMERFLASLIEHYGGAFPTWLSPVQVTIIPVADRHLNYAYELESNLKKDDIRTEIAHQQGTVNNKIRQAQNRKIPYMLIVGDREMTDTNVSVRLRNGTQKNDIPFSKFKEVITKTIREKGKELNI
ncbi:MAG: threonine--tRNA ligase [Dehalococcoidia bacterium]|nr:MAG: threonine--tRNA ligase [Dehalococcoidia bacterium]